MDKALKETILSHRNHEDSHKMLVRMRSILNRDKIKAKDKAYIGLGILSLFSNSKILVKYFENNINSPYDIATIGISAMILMGDDTIRTSQIGMTKDLVEFYFDRLDNIKGVHAK